VPNHTSSEHAWFRAALAAPPGSRERARPIFRDGRGPAGETSPNDWGSNFGGPASGQGVNAYAQRRRVHGKTNREIRRCLVRYVARQLYRLLEANPRFDPT
jgi:glycosidase